LIAVVDAGPLYAAADRRDQFHQDAIRALTESSYRYFVPMLVAAEAIYFVGHRLGPAAEAAFIEGLSDFEVTPPTAQDWERTAELVRLYSSFPLGAADASLIALAERLGTDVVISFDRRHFTAVRPRHVPAFRILPH